MQSSFIEKQFPVSKVSKESYKERKAGASQTLTGLGKWWGRKPLVLVRAAILGCLMPASDNPAKDMEIFLKIMSMDEEGLLLRKEKNLSANELYNSVISNQLLRDKYEQYFDVSDGKPKVKKDAPKDEIERDVFKVKGYDEKIALCKRPEQVENISDHAWQEINHHLHTNAHSLQELINQLSMQRFGHNVVVGDCFCGGGSIPFEAARIGCKSYGSDLNPVAGLLTWVGLHIFGATQKEKDEIKGFLTDIYNEVDRKIINLGIETNENNDRAISYMYCVEVKCPECGMLVPLIPSFIIGKKTRTVMKLIKHENKYDFEVKSNASDAEMKEAEIGTISTRGLMCPCCKKSTPVTSIRKDRLDLNGDVVYGLRAWGKEEYEPKEEDVYQERLYCIKYDHIKHVDNNISESYKYYRAPNERDIENERIISEIVSSHFSEWQEQGIIPSCAIEPGYNTDQLIRERGWRYWHQLFNKRQLLMLAMVVEVVMEKQASQLCKAVAILGLNQLADCNSQLCRCRNDDTHPNANTFYNQALNTVYNYAARSFAFSKPQWFCIPDISNQFTMDGNISLADARIVDSCCDYWITDPPYADAVNYHELTEFFIAWDKSLLMNAFPDWYADSKRTLAVRGDEHFSQTMIDIYSNLTQHMNDDGLQVVMFTHSDPAVWAQLALIMWKAGLTVTAAWNIATETDASGIKDGNYVKGTVLLVLRKQRGEETAFLDELNADIKSEVQKQIKSMQKLDDKEDPNFNDPDYVLAAYAASLKVLTSYHSIGEIDLDYELDLAIHDPAKSEVVKLIERAKKIAYDSIIPTEFDSFLWKELSAVERFYIKGLEAEKHGNYQVSTYQEYARGFGLSNYNQMMASDRANTARLKTPVEFAMRSVDVGNFEDTLLRHVLIAIHISVKDENPEAGLFYLKTTLPMYWESREMIKQLLGFMKDTKSIDTMPHWNECGEMAEHLYNLVDHDHV